MKLNLRCFLTFFLFPIIFSCEGQGQYRLGNGYFYDTISRSITFGENDDLQSDVKIISNRVVNYGVDEEFIVVKQIPNIEMTKNSISSELFGSFIRKKRDRYKESPDKDKGYTDSLNYQNLINKGFKGDNLDSDRKILDEISDSIFKNDPKYSRLFKNRINYWIIRKKNHKIYGPLDRNEYESKKKALKISQMLNLPR